MLPFWKIDPRRMGRRNKLESQKAALVPGADVNVSALEMTSPLHVELRSEPVPTLVTEVAVVSSEPIRNEEIAKPEGLVSNSVPFRVEVIAPVIKEEKVAVIEALKEVGIAPAAIGQSSEGG